MKKKAVHLILFSFLVFSVPAFAVDYDFFGNLQYHNSILSWNVTVGSGTVTVFTSSWDEGNFDPMLQVWAPNGDLLYQQDDGHNVGSTLSNGVPYSHGTWDTYYSLDVAAGTYTLTLSTYLNWAYGTNLSDPQWSYAGETPIPIAEWYQPANGYRGSYYAVHFLGADRVEDGGNNRVPEPLTMLLLGSGLVGVIGFGRKFRK